MRVWHYFMNFKLYTLLTELLCCPCGQVFRGSKYRSCVNGQMLGSLIIYSTVFNIATPKNTINLLDYQRVSVCSEKSAKNKIGSFSKVLIVRELLKVFLINIWFKQTILQVLFTKKRTMEKIVVNKKETAFKNSLFLFWFFFSNLLQVYFKCFWIYFY